MNTVVASWQLGLIPFLAVALVTDVRSRKIYNWLTFPAMGLGLVLAVAMGGVAGLTSSLIGFAAGTVLFLVGFLIGGMGAGDVKLMAAVGLWLGWPHVLGAVIYVALFGGINSVLSAMLSGSLGKMFGNVYVISKNLLVYQTVTKLTKETSATDAIPYGVAIVLGTLLALFYPDPQTLIHLVVK